MGAHKTTHCLGGKGSLQNTLENDLGRRDWRWQRGLATATVAGSLELLGRITKLRKPVVMMSYQNPIFRFGISKFVNAIAERGASALIVPGCPFDLMKESRSLRRQKSAGSLVENIKKPLTLPQKGRNNIRH